MFAAGQESEHADGVVCIPRLAHHLAANQHNCVGAKRHRVGMGGKCGLRFLLGEAPHVIPGRFEPEDGLVNLNGHCLELDTRSFQELGAARR